MRSLVLIALFVAATCGAQTMYKCSVGGRVEYSDKPCEAGNEVKRLAPDGGPTREDRERALMRHEVDRQKMYGGAQSSGATASGSMAGEAYTQTAQYGQVQVSSVQRDKLAAECSRGFQDSCRALRAMNVQPQAASASDNSTQRERLEGQCSRGFKDSCKALRALNGEVEKKPVVCTSFPGNVVMCP
jgi:hypothetical protein